MRTLFLTGLLCFAGAQSVFAIKTPSGDEVKEIQEQMFVGNRMDKDVVEAATALSDAKDAKAGDAEIIRLEKSLAREKDKQNAARTKAMHMAILAYGLEPANWSGTSVMPSTKGRTIKWLPRVRGSEDHDLRVGGEVLGTVKKDRTGYVGITYMDGVTIMDASAFEKGPGYLASYILHERIHFEQFTTHGKGNAMSYTEAQEAAYQAQVDNAEHFFDPKVPAQLRLMQDIEIARDTERAKAALEKKEGETILGRLRGLLPRAAPPTYFDAKIHTNAELADISGLVAQARGQAEMARREREEREAITRAAAEKSARLAHDERLKNAWADIARRSCANPGSITQAELDGLPKSNETPVMDTTPRGLGVCAATAYGLLRYGATAEQLRAASTPQLPINLQPSQQPRTPIRMNPSTPGFPSGFNPPVLPDLRQFAITACRAPDQAQIVHLYSPDYNYAYKEFDDKVARSLASGLDGCARKFFYQLIEMIRAREYWKIDGQWIRTTVASYKGVPSTSPNYTDPPGGGTAPPSQDDGCGTDPNGVQWCWK